MLIASQKDILILRRRHNYIFYKFIVRLSRPGSRSSSWFYYWHSFARISMHISRTVPRACIKIYGIRLSLRCMNLYFPKISNKCKIQNRHNQNCVRLLYCISGQNFRAPFHDFGKCLLGWGERGQTTNHTQWRHQKFSNKQL